MRQDANNYSIKSFIKLSIIIFVIQLYIQPKNKADKSANISENCVIISLLASECYVAFTISTIIVLCFYESHLSRHWGYVLVSVIAIYESRKNVTCNCAEQTRYNHRY